MSGGGGGGFNSEINVTPMVDIMLVLLIIFMVVTPMLQHGVTVNLPKDLNNPEEDQLIVKDTSVVIAIPSDGEYYIGKDRISKEQLKDRVEKMLNNIKKEEEKVVYIKSGVAVSYGDVVTVINEVRALGVDKIGLVADKKKGDGAAAPAKPA
ncbi:MAG TPA: biopolymer transporter ExbD [Pyrinomonadaceae bacterium]|nr:biopolymer transporter ExbD [Pyrinomonadaceae bacterium]